MSHFNAAPSFDDEPSVLWCPTASSQSSTAAVRHPLVDRTRSAQLRHIEPLPSSHIKRVKHEGGSSRPRAAPFAQRAELTSFCAGNGPQRAAGDGITNANSSASSAVDRISLTAHEAKQIRHMMHPTLTVCRSSDSMPKRHAMPAAAPTFHPHANSQHVDDEELLHPRAGLRLLENLVHAVRATSYGNASKATNRFPSINAYVDHIQVHHEGNAMILSVHLDRLFESIDGGTCGPSGDRLRAAHQQLRWRHGDHLNIAIRPNVAFQRPVDEFIALHVTGEPIEGPSMPRSAQTSTLFQFTDVFRGHPQTRLPSASSVMQAPHGWEDHEDIVCGFLIAEDPLLRALRHDMCSGWHAHPFEPTFFDALCGKFQFFNGDVSRRLARDTFATLNRLHGESPAASSSLHEDIVSAFSGAMYQRRLQCAAVGVAEVAATPQVFRPFILRDAAEASRPTTAPSCIGSVATGLHHGLRSITLAQVSLALDQAVILAVLQHCQAPLPMS